jgi:8-oxo-dGTP diphosphatase/putative hydrolase of the HAD superfamily
MRIEREGDQTVAAAAASAEALYVPVRDENGQAVIMKIDPKHIRWLFFDVGETLLDESDSMFDWCGQVADELTRRGHSCMASDVYAARQQSHLEFSPNVLQRILEILEVPGESSVYDIAKYKHSLEKPRPESVEAIAQLAPCFELGIIANQSAGTLQRLCNHGWNGVFQLCISSTEENLRKPDPAIFRLALERAQCPPEQAMMIGDRIDNDIRPAKSIGMGTIRLRQGLAVVQQPRGPDDEADATIESLAELPALLL